jgi:peptidyl-dipeptidase Dcp
MPNTRRTIVVAAVIAAVCTFTPQVLRDTASAQAPVTANVLVSPWAGPYGGVPPWDHAKPENFPAALQAALDEQRREIAAIAADTASPTFENTIVAMQRSGQVYDRVVRMFSVFRDNLSTPELQTVEREWTPKLAAAADEIAFNPRLFERVAAIHQSLPKSALTTEQKRLVTRTYEGLVRSGAKLDAAQKTRLSEINQGLAGLFTDFSSNVLADENTWTVLDSQADLAGLPDSVVAAAREAASERKLDGKWVIVNTRSSVDPVLTFSTHRDLRERVWKKFKSRGDNNDANDTKGIIAKIVKLRAERAKLLGFASHAHWRMSDTMARDPKNAMDLMMKVWPASVARVKEEVADMQAIASKEAPGTTIEPWDYLFYAEKVRKAKYDLDQAELKPYFELDNMVAAAMWSAERRYDIKFTEITGRLAVFHPDVRTFEVADTPSGRHRGLFYLDNFARQGKRSGAWAYSYRSQHRLGKSTAITSNNNNFVKGAPGEPVLISLDDATTLFHEFGHALHALLTDITYPGFGTTPRDFVEYPSQVNERWLLERETLDKFAKHYKTGQPMPQALVDKVKQSERFNQGYATVEYLAAAVVDMELHTRPDGVVDPAAFERESLARLGMPKAIALRHRLPQFLHLFSSDSYSAGYYSYLWSDVMAADTWQAFVEAGGAWDKKVADRLRKHILSDGNTIDRAEAYRLFRGRDPDVKALLEKRGFPTN